MGLFKLPKLSRDDRHDYDRHRARAYQGNNWDRYTKKGYDEYKEKGLRARDSQRVYWDQYTEVAGNERAPLEDLEAHQHRAVAPPASDAAVDTLSEALARQKFLERRPFAYQSHGIRRDHEYLAESSWADAVMYHNRSAEHITRGDDAFEEPVTSSQIAQHQQLMWSIGDAGSEYTPPPQFHLDNEEEEEVEDNGIGSLDVTEEEYPQSPEEDEYWLQAHEQHESVEQIFVPEDGEEEEEEGEGEYHHDDEDGGYEGGQYGGEYDIEYEEGEYEDGYDEY